MDETRVAPVVVVSIRGLGLRWIRTALIFDALRGRAVTRGLCEVSSAHGARWLPALESARSARTKSPREAAFELRDVWV